MVMDPNQLQAIALIVQGEDMEAVAAQVGVTSRTIRNWKREKNFAEEVRAQLTDIHEAFEARFNPALQRIQKLTDKFLDRLEKMLDSSDERIQLRGMQLHLQCLKWAGGKDNAGRGSGMCLDGILGPRVSVANLMHRSQQLDNLMKLMDSEPICDDPESGKNRKDPCRAGFPAGETPNSGYAKSTAADPEAEIIGNAQVAAQGESGGRGTPAPHSTISEPEKSSTAAQSSGISDVSPAGSRRDMTEAEKTGNAKPTPHKPWRGKGANHVPFYKKFQHR